MGCFNYTCAVSGLPICAGDDVRFLMLTQSPYPDSGSGLNAQWFARALPLRATYNDYGSVEGVKRGPDRDLWMRGFQLDLVEQGVGENTTHDVATSKGMSFEDLLVALWEERVLVSREVHERTRSRRPWGVKLVVSRTHPLLVRQAMIREDVWKALLRMRHPDIQPFRTFRTAVARSYQRTNSSKHTPGVDRVAERLVGRHRGDVLPFTVRNAFPSTVGVGTHIDLARRAGILAAILADTIAEFAYVQMMLIAANYIWRPGEPGGQDKNWGMHAHLHRELNRIARERAQAEAAELAKYA